MGLGTSSNLPSWDANEPILEHPVEIRRVYEHSCTCGMTTRDNDPFVKQNSQQETENHHNSELSRDNQCRGEDPDLLEWMKNIYVKDTPVTRPTPAVFDANLFRQAPEAVGTVWHDGVQYNTFTNKSTVTFVLFGDCGHQIDRQEWENDVSPNALQSGKVSESREFRTYIAQGPSCKKCTEDPFYHPRAKVVVDPAAAQASASKATQDASLDAMLRDMGGLNLERWHVDDLGDGMGGMKM